MNLRKKLMTGALVSVMAVALSTGWGSSTASAETGDISIDTFDSENGSSISVDFGSQTMTVKNNVGVNQEVMVCVPKVKTAKDKTTGKETKTVTETTWDVYEAATETTIDLSTLSTKATSYVMVKVSYTKKSGDKVSSEPLLIQFNAVSQTVKAAYDFSSVTVEVTCTDNKIKGSTLVGSGVVEYRTANGTWSDYGQYTTETDENGKSETSFSLSTAVDEDGDEYVDVDLSIYQQTGATLYFREAASETAKVAYNAKTDGVKISGDGGTYIEAGEDGSIGGYATLTLNGSFASAEAKCKITKLANGPSATINYDTHQMTIKKNCSYRTDYTSSEWKTTEDTTKTLDLDNDVTTGLVEIRTVATGKKAASKITRYAYEIAETSLVITTPLSITSDTEDTNIAGVKAESESEKDAYLTITSASANAKTGKLTVNLQNDTDKAYQICVLTAKQYSDATKDEGELDEQLKLGSNKGNLGKFTVTTIKAGKSGKITVPVDSYLAIREASDKKTGKYATTYTVLGTYGVTTTDEGSGSGSGE